MVAECLSGSLSQVPVPHNLGHTRFISISWNCSMIKITADQSTSLSQQYLVRCSLKRRIQQQVIPQLDFIIIPKFSKHCPCGFQATTFNEQGMQEEKSSQCQSIFIHTFGHLFRHYLLHTHYFGWLQRCIEAFDLAPHTIAFLKVIQQTTITCPKTYLHFKDKLNSPKHGT